VLSGEGGEVSGWYRLLAILATATVGLSGAFVILSADKAPKWTLALSGVLGLAGLAAAVVLLAIVVSVIIEDVRPTVRVRKPAGSLALSHREAAMHGRLRFRMHPIRFWGVLTLNNRFLLGFMVFSEPEYLDARKELDEGAPDGRAS
jgi:hypothetical protein